MMEDGNIDLLCSLGLAGVFASALLAFVVASIAWGRRHHERLERERGLPLIGKLPLEAVYAAIVPVGRAVANAGISANTISITSLGLAAAAGLLFATGHFGVGAAIAVMATLADALDGIVARESGTSGRFGQVLDTTIDRYVDVFLLGGIAIHVRGSMWMLALTLAAITGGFMVSYASSVLRELGADDRGAPMRRAHRITYLLSAATLVPFVGLAKPTLALTPLMAALAAIGVVGNVSAVTRLFRAARTLDPNIVSPPKKRLAGTLIDTVVTPHEHHR